MKLRYKILLGAGAVAVVSAASSPGFGLAQTTWQQREALARCQQASSTFMAFLPSDREDCYSRMRTATTLQTGLWSRHDRSQGQLALAAR
jgi:hypothetical protein